ncbi:MAG: extracellular solute-binding protein [Arenicella sp.]
MALNKRVVVRILICMSLCVTADAFASEVNVYSSRKQELIKPALDKFTEKTGVRVHLISAKADVLMQRILIEGSESPADLLLTTDVSRLDQAKSIGLFQPVTSRALLERVPARLRDPEMAWYGLSLRARPIFYAKDKVNPKYLQAYSSLADPQWQGRVCMRSSNNLYNQSLVASVIYSKGVRHTKNWLSKLVANFSREPTGGDKEQLMAVAAGVCDLTIANTYYYGQLLQEQNTGNHISVNNVGIFWPNQADRGVHMNVSGAGVLKSAKNKENAIRLMEFLTSLEIQQWYGEVNHEFPIVESVLPSQLLRSWGDFKKDEIALSVLAELNAYAKLLMRGSNWP